MENDFYTESKEPKSSKEVKKLCEELYDHLDDEFEYGVIKDGKLKKHPSNKDIERYYHFQSPEEFEKYGGGICTDFAEYEEKWLTEHGVTCRKFYVITETPPDYDTHTYVVIPCEDKFIWVEWAMEKLEGVHIFNNLRDLHKMVAWGCFSSSKNKEHLNGVKYSVLEYTGKHPEYGCSMEDFMDWMSEHGKWSFDDMAKKEKPNVVMEQFFDEGFKENRKKNKREHEYEKYLEIDMVWDIERLQRKVSVLSFQSDSRSIVLEMTKILTSWNAHRLKFLTDMKLDRIAETEWSLLLKSSRKKIMKLEAEIRAHIARVPLEGSGKLNRKVWKLFKDLRNAYVQEFEASRPLLERICKTAANVAFVLASYEETLNDDGVFTEGYRHSMYDGDDPKKEFKKAIKLYENIIFLRDYSNLKKMTKTECVDMLCETYNILAEIYDTIQEDYDELPTKTSRLGFAEKPKSSSKHRRDIDRLIWEIRRNIIELDKTAWSRDGVRAITEKMLDVYEYEQREMSQIDPFFNKILGKGVAKASNSLIRGIHEYSQFDTMDDADLYQEAKLSSDDRKELKDKQFGIPSLRKYPLTDEKHVLQAVRFFNKAPEEHKEELAKNIVKRAKQLGMDWEKWESIKPYLDDNVQEAVYYLNPQNGNMAVRVKTPPPVKDPDGGEMYEMDEIIIPFIRLANRKGYKTKFCCAGHGPQGPMLDGTHSRANHSANLQPYVMFDKKYDLGKLPSGWKPDEDIVYPNDELTIRYEMRHTMPDHKKDWHTYLDIYNEIIDAWKSLCTHFEKLPDISKSESKQESWEYQFYDTEIYQEGPIFAATFGGFLAADELHKHHKKKKKKKAIAAGIGAAALAGLAGAGALYQKQKKDDKAPYYPIQRTHPDAKKDNKIYDVKDFKYDKVYFGTPNEYKDGIDCDRPLFVTPYKSLACIFAVSRKRKELGIPDGRFNYDYKEWGQPKHEYIDEIHMTVEGLPDEEEHTMKDIEGYVYEVDVSDLKDHIGKYQWMTPQLEYLIYDVDHIDWSNQKKVNVTVHWKGKKSNNPNYHPFQEAVDINDLKQQTGEVFNQALEIKYGCLDENGERITSSPFKDSWQMIANYHSQSIQSMQESKLGVCFEHSFYVAYLLKQRNLPYQTFFLNCNIEHEENHSLDTTFWHQFTIVPNDTDSVVLIETSLTKEENGVFLVQDMEDAVQHLIKSFHIQLSPEDQELMKQDLIDVSTLEPRDGETYIGYIDRVYREGKAIKDEINIKKKNNLVRVYWDYLNEKQYLTEEGQKVYQQIQEMDESTSFDIATLVNVPQLLTEEGQNFHNNSGIYKGEGFFEMTPKKLESTLKGFIQESYMENHHNTLKEKYHYIPLTKQSIKKYQHQGVFKYGLHQCRVNDNTKGAIYIDENHVVVGYFAVEKKTNGERWITALEVSEEFQGHGFGVDLLQLAVDEYGAEYLSCNKENKKALHLYGQHGWKTYDESDNKYFMKLNS